MKNITWSCESGFWRIELEMLFFVFIIVAETDLAGSA
jgi:hypothetical protein